MPFWDPWCGTLPGSCRMALYGFPTLDPVPLQPPQPPHVPLVPSCALPPLHRGIRYDDSNHLQQPVQRQKYDQHSTHGERDEQLMQQSDQGALTPLSWVHTACALGEKEVST